MDITAIAAALKRGELVMEHPSPLPTEYRYQPYPRWLYCHGQDPQLVASAHEERALGSLWATSPQGALDAKNRLDEFVALAAAAREYDDRRLGPQARAELDAYQRAAGDHVLDVPARKED